MINDVYTRLSICSLRLQTLNSLCVHVVEKPFSTDISNWFCFVKHDVDVCNPTFSFQTLRALWMRSLTAAATTPSNTFGRLKDGLFERKRICQNIFKTTSQNCAKIQMIQRYPWKRKNFHPFGDQRKQWKLIWMRRICGQCKVYDGRWLSGYIFIHSWARRCIYRYTRVYRGTQRRGQPWAGGGKPPNLPGSYSQAWSLDPSPLLRPDNLKPMKSI